MLRVSIITRLAVAAYGFVALLAGCAGGGSPAAVPLSSSVSTQSIARTDEAFASTTSGFVQNVDAKSALVYMSTWATLSAVNVFTIDGKQVGQIVNGLANLSVGGLFVDSKSNLWVAAIGTTGNVFVYPRGALSPSKKLTDPVGGPVDVTICPDGTAYVADIFDNANENAASIQIFPPGTTKPAGSLTYTTDFRNGYLTCDVAGNVFVSIFTSGNIGSGRVIEFPGGKEAGAKDLGITLGGPGGIKQDRAGNLLVSDFNAQTITEYTEAGVPTGRSFNAGTYIDQIAITSDGTKVIGAAPAVNEGIAWSFPAGKRETVFSCCSRIGPPLQVNEGVAIDSGRSSL